MFIMFPPCSSYSFFLIHIFSKGVRQERTLPPIQELYFLSEGQFIMKLIEFPPMLVMFLQILSAMFGKREFPPMSKIFSNKLFLTSVSMEK